MAYRLNIIHELNVHFINMECSSGIYEEGSEEYIRLSLSVASSELNHDPEKFTGEIELWTDNLSSAPYGIHHGYCTFHTVDRFSVGIRLPINHLMRIWQVYAAQPQWFSINFEEMPEATSLGEEVTGEFRICYRAGYDPKMNFLRKGAFLRNPIEDKRI